MSHDDKLKEFLRQNDSNTYITPTGEFEKIYHQATVKNWGFYLAPAIAMALLILAVRFSGFKDTQKIATENSLNIYIVNQMEYSMLNSEVEVGSYYFDLIEE